MTSSAINPKAEIYNPFEMNLNKSYIAVGMRRPKHIKEYDDPLDDKTYNESLYFEDNSTDTFTTHDEFPSFDNNSPDIFLAYEELCSNGENSTDNTDTYEELCSNGENLADNLVTVGERRQAFLEEFYNYLPSPNSTILNLPRTILSQHVRIEALVYTNSLCRKGFGETPEFAIPGSIKLFCAASGAYTLVGTNKLTSWIEKAAGPIAEAAFDLTVMTGITLFSIYAPHLAVKFTQTALLTGVFKGQVIREGLAIFMGPVPIALSALDLAANDMITAGISLGGANYLYNPSIEASLAQENYRTFDIPLNYVTTLVTNSMSFVTSSAITLCSLAARSRSLDFAPKKTPIEMVGVFLGLFLGAISFTTLPWWRGTIESEEQINIEQPNSSSLQTDQEQICPAGDATCFSGEL